MMVQQQQQQQVPQSRELCDDAGADSPTDAQCCKYHLDIHAAGGIVLNKKLLENRRRCAHSPYSDTTERGLLIVQGVLGHQPHPVHYLVGQVLVHRAVVACEGLQR